MEVPDAAYEVGRSKVSCGAPVAPHFTSPASGEGAAASGGSSAVLATPIFAIITAAAAAAGVPATTDACNPGPTPPQDTAYYGFDTPRPSRRDALPVNSCVGLTKGPTALTVPGFAPLAVATACMGSPTMTPEERQSIHNPMPELLLLGMQPGGMGRDVERAAAGEVSPMTLHVFSSVASRSRCWVLCWWVSL